MKIFRACLISVLLTSLSSKVFCADEAAAPKAESKSGGRTVAIVNNEPIFASELEKEAEPFIRQYKQTAPESDQTPEKIAGLKKEILDRLIEEKLLLQEARNKKIKVLKTELEKGIDQFKAPFAEDEKGKPRDPGQIEKAFQDQLIKEGMSQDQFNKRVEEQIMKVKLVEQDVKSKVELPSPAVVKEFFGKIQARMAGKEVKAASPEEEAYLDRMSKYYKRKTGPQVRIRHIMIRSPKTAAAAERAEAKKKLDGILQKIKNGEDFAFLAKKYTEDPLSKERGGDLGEVAKGDMGLPEIDEVIFKMKEGDVSPVIQTDIGYHVVKVIEKKAPHPLEFDEVSEELQGVVAQISFEQKLKKYLQSLRAKANVKVNSID